VALTGFEEIGSKKRKLPTMIVTAKNSRQKIHEGDLLSLSLSNPA